jgi:hypothetical protein
MPPDADFSSPLEACEPVTGGPLHDVEDLARFVRDLKRPPYRVLVSGIFGWPAASGGTYRVGRSSNGRWDYAPICQSSNGEATAGLRLERFISALGGTKSIHSICDGDFGPALRAIGDVDAELCLTSPLADTRPEPGLQPDCRVTEDGPDELAGHGTPVPPCGAGTGGACWQVLPDRGKCAWGYFLDLPRSEPPPVGTRLSVKCLTCARAGDPRCAPTAH